MPNPIRKQSTQRTRNRSTDEQIPNTQRELVLSVEEGEVDVQAGEEAGFYSAEEETACEECAVGINEAGERSDEAPCCGDEGDPAAGGEEFEDQVGGDLEEEVGDEEDGDGDLELLGGEVEVCLEVVEAGVANVDSAVC